ncbi:MAG: cytochrome c biogenesis protein CcsA, partial [Gammaproteobacteria bacterium]|nr:cytochrome c biogenesis protein CcsA [Gammaproteobacteria bacterium]
MIIEFANWLLILTLLVSFCGFILPLIGSYKENVPLMQISRVSIYWQFFGLLLAFLGLIYGILSNDFSVKYIAAHSNTLLPWPYKIAAAWGGHEGSLLLWSLLLSAWQIAFTKYSNHFPPSVLYRVLLILNSISCVFLLFILSTSNPFERIDPPLAEGRDLNPILQDPGLVIHP